MSKFKALVESTGYNFKKQIITLIIIDIIIIALGVAGYLYFKNMIVVGGIIVAFLTINYLYLTRYKSIKNIRLNDELNEFVSLMAFFKVYIANSYTVYQSIKELCNFTVGNLLDKFQTLIGEIDEDKTVTPFINFAMSFNSLQIEQLMICIYQMIDEGSNYQYITQFELLFNKLRDEMLKSELHIKESGLSSMTLFPLIGSALIIVMITFGVVAIIGETINGI